jgi:tripartite-type tricarboxylate transporter receptor subunit TctC
MRTGLILAVALALSGAARAEDFYKGRTIELVVSTGIGSTLDENARLVARHLGEHIPGRPLVVVRNMPGAQHKRAANFLYNQAARDGTSIGALNPVFALAQVLDARGVQYDAAKFEWLGSTASLNAAIYVSSGHAVKNAADTTRWQVLMGAAGPTSPGAFYPTAMNNLLGSKFYILAGYANIADMNAALERGEIEGRAGQSLNALKLENPDWLRGGKIRVIAQAGIERDPEFPDAPLLTELAANEADAQVLRLLSADTGLGRIFLSPPETPRERVAILRKALADVVEDEAFRNAARNAGLDVRFRDGASVQGIVTSLVNASPETIARAKAALQVRDFLEPGKVGDRKE